VARIASGRDCVKHDLRAILKQDVGSIEDPVEFDEDFPHSVEEYDLDEPAHRAQPAEGYEEKAQDFVRVILKLQVALVKGESEEDPVQNPIDKLHD